MTVYFIQAFIYLSAAVLMVPLAKRLGLGSVLGYLIAGVIIGPVAGLVGSETTDIQHFAEFGVVMMLFIVGLELQPALLWKMRGRLIGLGGLQVSVTAALVFMIALLFGLQWRVALAIGLIFSLSSTAIVLQTFNEKGLGKTEGGRSAFSVLLFQDIAVIPMLALLPLLALPELQSTVLNDSVPDAHHHEALSLVAHLPSWATALVVLGSIGGLVIGGHYLSRPLFRFVASSGLREAFTAAALMLVIGVAALMSLVGLSPALGAFLAGVVLANSEFRHELEADIEPFKGLLLGLFFITVGAGIDFGILVSQILLVLTLTLGVMLLKAAVLLVIAFIFRVHSSDRWLFSLSLAQAGEFGFVLLSYAVGQSVLPPDIAQLLSLVVALSMFLTPVLFIVFEKVISPRYKNEKTKPQQDEITDQGTVIIAGIGRFGQIVNRLLIANDIETVVLDHQVSQVDRLRRVNIKSFYGDASRLDLLHSAGIDEAKALVVAIDDKQKSLDIVEHAKKEHPHLKVLARAYDRGHHYELLDAGADFVISETYNSALQLGGQTLVELGLSAAKAESIKENFKGAERQHFEDLYRSWRDKGESKSFDDHYRNLFIQMEEKLLRMMKEEPESGSAADKS